jgi:hypothetical protein
MDRKAEDRSVTIAIIAAVVVPLVASVGAGIVAMHFLVKYW